ncbi:MAG TPA: hypothetical protein VFD71_03765 [Planctomycetota bacterium]|nr:hypothetical protein [Planctomycetota bacterium]
MHLIAPCRKVRAPVFAALVAGCLCGAGTPRASAAPCIPTTPISAVAAALVGQTGSSRKLNVKDSAATAAPGSTARGGAKPGGSTSTPAASGQAPVEASGSWMDNLVDFIRDNAMTILIALGALLLVVLGWMFVASRKKSGNGQDPFAELGLGEAPRSASGMTDTKRFSSTKIHASDVNSRVSGSVTTTQVETDREYALVVDEEDLKMPPLPEEVEGGPHAGDAKAIRELIDTRDYDGAFREFLRQVKANSSTGFEGDVERVLGEHLIRSKEYAKATQVLEHHVATRPKADVKPEIYFNLGYLHFQQKTLAQSRRYLDLFVKTETNPIFVTRAKKILTQIRGSTERN